MQAVELPLVESDEEGVVYLLFPNFDDSNYQGVQYEIYPEKGIIYLFCYEEGFEEEGDCTGVGYPVAVPEENMNFVTSMLSLKVIDPEKIEKEDLRSEDEYRRIQDRYSRFKKDESVPGNS